jgi:hypothetical protein
MHKHRIIITSATVFILLSCFSSQSEGRSFYPLGKVFAGPLYHKWRADARHPLTNLFYCNIQDREAGDTTSACSSSPHFLFFDEISCIPEKSHVFPNGYQCTFTSQRPPPFIEN